MTVKEELVRVGNNLRTIRTAKGMSIESLAALSQTDEVTLIFIENGQSDFLLTLIAAIAEKLNIDFRKILVGTVYRNLLATGK